MDLISRQAAISHLTAVKACVDDDTQEFVDALISDFGKLPSAQPEIIRCKECEYGNQDEDGLWYCRSFGCVVGDVDGNGFCADAERRTDGKEKGEGREQGA